MRISNREKLLLAILILAVLGYLFYNFVYISNQEKIALLEEEAALKNEQVDELMQSIEEGEELNKEFKELNFEISDMSKSYLPNLNQEKLIVFIDDKLKEYQIETSDINFSSPEITNFTIEPSNESFGYRYRLEELKDVYLGVVKETPAEEEQESIKVSVESSQFDINFNADYYLLLDFINDLQNNQFEVTLSNMNLAVAENDIMNGNLIMSIYSIPKLHEHDYMNWVWSDYIEAGRSNPFFESDIQRDQYWTARYDFVMNIKPISSDLPTVTLGEEDDYNRDSYVYADSNSIETVNIEVMQEGEIYYYKYKTNIQSFPLDYDNEWIEFTPENEFISMHISSEERTGEDDQSGVKLEIVNNSDLLFYVNVLNEDLTNPRVEYTESGNVVFRVNE